MTRKEKKEETKNKKRTIIRIVSFLVFRQRIEDNNMYELKERRHSKNKVYIEI